jgi:hypothetical protein
MHKVWTYLFKLQEISKWDTKTNSRYAKADNRSVDRIRVGHYAVFLDQIINLKDV